MTVITFFLWCRFVLLRILGCLFCLGGESVFAPHPVRPFLSMCTCKMLYDVPFVREVEELTVMI